MVAISQIPAQIAALLIKGYRLTLSKLLGQKCRFYPSCSSYSLEAFQRCGFLKGFFLSVGRLIRCNPLFRGGIDPLPEINSRNKG